MKTVRDESNTENEIAEIAFGTTLIYKMFIFDSHPHPFVGAISHPICAHNQKFSIILIELRSRREHVSSRIFAHLMIVLAACKTLDPIAI